MRVIGAIPSKKSERYNNYLISLEKHKPSKQEKINYRLYKNKFYE